MSDNATILIVDDNRDTLGLLFNGLHQAGYYVMVAEDARSALTRIAMRRPDLIVLDLIMPGMDGFELTSLLKADPASRDIPVIFITALNETAHIVRGFAAGGVDYLVKPLRMEEVLARINTHISLHMLRRRLETRNRELDALLAFSQSLALHHNMHRLGAVILSRLERVISYGNAVLLAEVEGDMMVLAMVNSPAATVSEAEPFPYELLLSAMQCSYHYNRPVIIPDLHAEQPIAAALEQQLGEQAAAFLGYTRSWMLVPLPVNQAVIGWLSLSHQQPGIYQEQHADLIMAFANQAAIALENARLYQQVQHVAIHEERNRLAQNLHDSVSQALFSASLIAEVLPQIQQHNPAAVADGLHELQRLTRGALVEMRTLLIELRPTTILKQRLDDLLRQLSSTVANRTLVQVQLDLAPLPELPPEVHLTFYRVAQEAFNNISRHARATQINVALHSDANDRLMMEIRDDGLGFEPEHMPPGAFGLEIMHERAQQIGATIAVTSRPGQGTQIVLHWPWLQEGD